MKVSFLDFWGDLHLDNNFIFNILREIKEEVILVNPDDADIIFCSIFGDKHKSYFGRKKIIFFTGENIRPDFKSYDYSISFDFDDYNGRNIRVPLWYFYIDWFNKKTYGNPNYLIPENYLYEDNEFKNKSKNDFCCTVFSASYPERFEMINKLNKYKQVDGYGKVHNNRIPDGEKVKLSIVSNYKFNICFENSIYPGYFTEKLLHAKISGSIPIYNADNTMNIDFNENCCLNLNKLSYDEILNNVIELDNNNKLFDKLAREPIFNNKIDINEIINKIKTII